MASPCSPSLHESGSCGHKELFSWRSWVPFTSSSPSVWVSEKLNKVSFCVSGHILQTLSLNVRDAFIFFGVSPFTDADVGQIPHGRRPEGPQTADHSLSAR